MLVSMTGFGRGESRNENHHVVAEVRTVNNRFLDVVTRLPKSLAAFENEVKELVRQRITRGRISVSVNLNSVDVFGLEIRANMEAARGIKSMLTQLQDELKLGGTITLDHLLKFPDVFGSMTEEADETLWKYAKEAIEIALDEMVAMKIKEGEYLAGDLLKRIQKIEDYVGEIKQLSKQHIKTEYKALKQRLEEILQSPDIDEKRLEMEIAFLADRLDVTEECVRFKSHIQLFRDLVNGPEYVGRRLNFLLQEMNREANTIGSKANNADISHRVVFVKEEIEKIREQVQNVE